VVKVCSGQKNAKEAIKELASAGKDSAIFWDKERAAEFLEKKFKQSKEEVEIKP
jgi:hypothetical protein